MSKQAASTSFSSEEWKVRLNCGCTQKWEGIIPNVADYLTCRLCGRPAVVVEVICTTRTKTDIEVTFHDKHHGWYIMCQDCIKFSKHLYPGTELQAMMMVRDHLAKPGKAEHHILVINNVGDVHYDKASRNAA